MQRQTFFVAHGPSRESVRREYAGLIPRGTCEARARHTRLNCRGGRTRLRAQAEDGADEKESLPPRPNVSKLTSQRSLISTRKEDVSPAEINDLFSRSGWEERDEEKWKIALKHSYCVVTARLFKTRKLVGFVRATSDLALNATMWDLAVDASLPDPTAMKRNIVKYLLTELRTGVPGCSVALISRPGDVAMFESLQFVADPDGIKAMALVDDLENFPLLL
mmetsp:Transcript_2020/g.5376  ORF Transcript_2020/g.5376 Transcript_2020/m.5376 type:complete len:221 (-) Transcript_2020:187-849(-)